MFNLMTDRWLTLPGLSGPIEPWVLIHNNIELILA
jgi:hypothetical protein